MFLPSHANQGNLVPVVFACDGKELSRCFTDAQSTGLP